MHFILLQLVLHVSESASRRFRITFLVKCSSNLRHLRVENCIVSRAGLSNAVLAGEKEV